MGTVHVDAEIAAPVASVWAVLADIGGWAGWNEVIVDGRCDGGAGSRVTCRVRVGPIWFPVATTVHTWIPETSLIWGEDRGRILQIHHGFRLEATDRGTRIEHFERFEGWVGRAVYPWVQGSLHRNYASFLDALKARVEGLGPGTRAPGR